MESINRNEASMQRILSNGHDMWPRQSDDRDAVARARELCIRRRQIMPEVGNAVEQQWAIEGDVARTDGSDKRR